MIKLFKGESNTSMNISITSESHCIESGKIRKCGKVGKSECGKIRTRKTPNTDTFHAVSNIQINIQDFINYDHIFNILCQKIL